MDSGIGSNCKKHINRIQEIFTAKFALTTAGEAKPLRKDRQICSACVSPRNMQQPCTSGTDIGLNVSSPEYMKSTTASRIDTFSPAAEKVHLILHQNG
jgi:hypothetical protein